MKSKIKANRLFLLFLFAFLSLLWLIPLALTVSISMKETQEYMKSSLVAPPSSIRFLIPNVTVAWNLSNLGSSFLNSLLYAPVSSSLAVILASLAAYSLTKLKVRGRVPLFFLIYSGTVFPFQIYLIPLFVMYMRFNIYDTRLGMLLFYTAICIPFCLFVLHNYFITIPDTIIEAATIDGASSLRIYFSIIFPMSIAPMLALMLLQFTWVWNDLLFGLILTKSANTRPVMVSLMQLSSEAYSIGSMPQRLAAALIVSLPSFTLFFLLRRYFLTGFRMLSVAK